MRLHGYKNTATIISILLMMVCVQTFSMHFHFTNGDDEHQHHAHSHSLDSAHTDHMTEEHHDESTTDILGTTLAKQSISFYLFIPVLLALVVATLSKSRHWSSFREKRPQHHLLFFRPPLRAPPL